MLAWLTSRGRFRSCSPCRRLATRVSVPYAMSTHALGAIRYAHWQRPAAQVLRNSIPGWTSRDSLPRAHRPALYVDGDGEVYQIYILALG
jgi:hypothetical protein